ncbi:MAG: AAA family ATPase [Clostridia bacterium]|jgi:guanylate kinase|nr:AAA family ATPase [Clostridia bacterium]MDD3231832.1 AAA family ATPase [Clostridia bacterium]
MLIIISGFSGSGKNTVINELIKRNENLSFLKSCTTRKKRPNENKDAYIFLCKKTFDKMLEKGDISEYEEIHQNFYGIAKSSLDEVVSCDKEKKHFIKDVGVLGQISLTRILKDKVKTLSIFLTAPKKELIKRLTLRGEPDIDLRLSRMEFEENYKGNFDIVINNANLNKTIKIIEKLIKKNEVIENTIKKSK